MAAGESINSGGGQRLAPVGVQAEAGGDWRRFGLALTSETGKVSALDCRVGAGGGLEVWAIERHYEVSRVLFFEVPAEEASAGGVPVLSPKVVWDLSRGGSLPNFEGLLHLGDGRIVLAADNDYGGADGPTLVWILPAAD